MLMTAAAWLDKLWPVILAGVMGLFGIFVGYRLTARRTARLEHLNAIKTQVFRPLRDELESFYLPLLQEKLGPVTIESKRRNLGGSINKPSVMWESYLAARRNPSLAERQEQVPTINSELHMDAKTHHYTALLGRLETFKDAVIDYCLGWVLYAEHLSQTLATKTGLPPLKEESANVDRTWIDANRLALFTLNWQLGIVLHAPWVSSDGLSIEISGQTVVRAESRESIQNVLDAVEVISRDRGRLEELRQPLPTLRRECTELVAELERKLFLSSLPGRCAFVKT